MLVQAYPDVTEKSFSFFNHNAKQLKIKVLLADFNSVDNILFDFQFTTLYDDYCRINCKGNKYECTMDQELQIRTRRASGQPADAAAYAAASGGRRSWPPP